MAKGGEIASENYSVWVGNLAKEVTEDELRYLFQRFGPIHSVKIPESRGGQEKRFGFVNFHNEEDARKATSQMNNKRLLGIPVKTNLKSKGIKPKDIRPFTDCLNFIRGKPCNQNCYFRHSKIARCSKVVCKKWQNRSCLDFTCENRHPGSKELELQSPIQEDPKPKIYSVPFKLFKKTILLLLHGNPGRGVTFSQLRVELESFGGSSLDMRSLGFNSPNDMIKALEPDIQVRWNGAEHSFFLNEPSLWEFILDALALSTNHAILWRSLPERYQIGKEALLSAAPESVKVFESDLHIGVVLRSKYEELVAVDDLTRICALLYRSPEFKLKAQEIKDHFKEGAEPIIRKAVEGGMDAGHIKVLDDKAVLGSSVALRYFCFQVISVLYQSPKQGVLLSAFSNFYHKRYGRQYKKADFGFKKVEKLFESLPENLVELENIGGEVYVQLSLAGEMFEEIREFLAKNNGAALLSALLDICKKENDFYSVASDSSLLFFLQKFPELFCIFEIEEASSSLIVMKNIELASSNGVSESRKEKTEKRSAIFNDSVKTSDVGGSENSPGKLAGGSKKTSSAKKAPKKPSLGPELKKVAQSYGLVKNDDDIAVLDKKDIKNYMDLYASDESDDSVIVESEGGGKKTSSAKKAPKKLSLGPELKKVDLQHRLVKNDDDIAVLVKKDTKNYLDLYASDESDYSFEDCYEDPI